ncbi:hypothetical protein LTR04_007288 [Oleoguttula sp. CCFEE 6159]|nr:hypothetical protein LTR04_007288 [Oleoguttula sp. CCFEE 6159]
MVSGLPTFYETSSPELDSLLSTVRNKIFLFDHLNQAQLKLVRQDSLKERLAAEPVYARIGDEDVRLEHINVTKDIPRSTTIRHEMLNLLKEPKDWDNVPAFLEGFSSSKSAAPLGFDFLDKLVRRASEAGQQHIILQCLQMVEKTGMSLRKLPLVESVMWSARKKAQEGNWDNASTEKALKYAEQVAALMETEAHGTGRLLQKADPRKAPSVIGFLLELAAVRAYKHTGGKDVDGKVKKYAERLLAALPAPSETSEAREEMPFGQVEAYVPVWQGLKFANKVLGPEMPQAERVQKILADYEKTILERYKSMQDQKTRNDRGYVSRGMKAWQDRIKDT